MNKILNTKRAKTTMALFGAYLWMMVFVACVDDPDINPFGECGGPYKVNATDVSLFYEPYLNDQYATEKDTVKLSEFNIFLKIASEPTADASHSSSSFPGRAYALSCAPSLDFQNINSISMTLLAPYGDKEAGTNISSFVTTHEDIKISDLQDFKRSLGLYKLTVNLLPENKSQLKTRTVLKFKNGTEKTFDSTSPVLLTN